MAELSAILKAINERQSAQRDSGAFWAGREQRLGPFSCLRMGGRVFPDADDYTDKRACAVRLSGNGFEYRTDKQHAFGRSGKKSLSVGYHPSLINAEIRVWRIEQWIALAHYIPTIHPKVQPGKRTAYAVEHPFLSAFSISNVYVNKMSLPEPGEHRMLYVLRMELEEIFDLRDDEPKVLRQAGDGDSTSRVNKDFRALEGSTEYEARP